MREDDNDNILKLYIQLKEIKRFPAKCPVCGKMNAHTIWIFMILKPEEGDFGYGVVSVIHFLIVHCIYLRIGKTAL